MYKEDMYKEDRALFSQAIGEAFDRKFDRALLQNTEAFQCSESHLQKMAAIIENAQKQTVKGRRKWIVALLVAAAILLTGCTVYVFREEIRNFVEEVFDKHIKVMCNDGEEVAAAAEITDRYTLTALPEGYVLVDEFFSPVLTTIRWEKEPVQYIEFEQYILDSTSCLLDAEKGETITMEIEPYTVYYRCYSDVQKHCYIWNDGEYAFKLFTSEPFDENTLKQVIAGMKIQ